MTMASGLGAACVGGVCDANGKCVDCLSATDWTTCGGASCLVKRCQGQACTAGAECGTGKCVDNHCCNEDCTGECMSCAVAGSEGTCTNVPYYLEDPIYKHPITMVDTKCDIAMKSSKCDGNGVCLKIIEKICNEGADCLSGSCFIQMGAMTGNCLGAAGEPCSDNSLCVSGACDQVCKGQKDAPCHANSDCQSSKCTAGLCT